MKKGRVFTEKELQEMEEIYNRPGRSGSYKAVSMHFKIDEKVIKKHLIKRGISQKPRQECNTKFIFTEVELQKMEEIYSRTGKLGSLSELGRQLGVNKLTGRKHLVRRGIIIKSPQTSRRFKPCNVSYFNKIDTEEKAYWLGFLYADGCIGRDGQVRFALKDIEPLEEFKKALDSEHTIYKRDNNRGTSNKKDIFLFWLTIGSKKMCSDLINKGCLHNKTKELYMPTREQVPLEFMGPFLRGFFDGDGCIHLQKREKTLKINISLNQTFAEGLCSFLSNEVGIEKKYNKGHGGSQIQMSGKKMYKFLDYIYRDATVFLARKKHIYDTYRRDK